MTTDTQEKDTSVTINPDDVLYMLTKDDVDTVLKEEGFDHIILQQADYDRIAARLAFDDWYDNILMTLYRLHILPTHNQSNDSDIDDRYTCSFETLEKFFAPHSTQGNNL